MTLKHLPKIILALGACLLLEGCIVGEFVDDQLYKGSTPVRRGNTRNTIFDREGDISQLKRVEDQAIGTYEAPQAAAPKASGVWQTDINTALAAAKASKKPLFVSFSGSDWCHFCQKLDSDIYGSAVFKQFAKNEVIPVQIDFPKKTQLPTATATQNRRLKAHYQIEGLPSIVLLKPDGSYIGRGGYQDIPPAQFVDAIRNILAESM